MGAAVPAVSTGSFLPAANHSSCPSCHFRTYAVNHFKCDLCSSKSRIVKGFLEDCAGLLAEPDLQEVPKIALVLQDVCREPVLVTGDYDLLFHTKPTYRAPMVANFKPGFWDVYRRREQELFKTQEMQMPEVIPGTDIYTMFTMFSTDTNLYIAAFAMTEIPDDRSVSA